MKIIRKIQINKPAAEVWQVLGKDFEHADQWMSAVPKSYAKQVGTATDGAPIIGRICELTPSADGPIADETITFYDEDQYNMQLNVVPKQGKIPVVQNNAEISVKRITPDTSEVIWASDLELKPVGKLLYPVVKAGVGKSFTELLEELKYFVETGEPHPRKVAKNQKLLQAV